MLFTGLKITHRRKRDFNSERKWWRPWKTIVFKHTLHCWVIFPPPLSLFFTLFLPSIIFSYFILNVAPAGRNGKLIKYQWSIHHSGESKWNGHLLSLNNAGKFCHKALNYSSTFSVSDSDIVKINMLQWERCRLAVFIFVGNYLFISEFIKSHQSVSGMPKPAVQL